MPWCGRAISIAISNIFYTVCLASHLCPVRSLFTILAVSRSFDVLGVQVGLVVLGGVQVALREVKGVQVALGGVMGVHGRPWRSRGHRPP